MQYSTLLTTSLNIVYNMTPENLPDTMLLNSEKVRVCLSFIMFILPLAICIISPGEGISLYDNLASALEYSSQVMHDMELQREAQMRVYIALRSFVEKRFIESQLDKIHDDSHREMLKPSIESAIKDVLDNGLSDYKDTDSKIKFLKTVLSDIEK